MSLTVVTLLAAAAVAPGVGVFPVEAAPAASPVCNTGYGLAGKGGSTQASTAGGHGCVVVEYVVGGVTYFETFNYTGALQSWVVPAGAETAKFMTYGAGGGGTNTGAQRTNGLDNDRINSVTPVDSLSWYSDKSGEGPLPVAHDGGVGGSATGTFVVTPGETISVLVGQGGIGNSDDRCLPASTRIGTANGNGDDLTRGLDAEGFVQLWPINGVPSNTDPNARQGFGGGGRASAFHNTRAFFPIRTTNTLGRDHDECINPYFAAGGGRSEVLRGSTRLVTAGGGGGAGFFGAGGAGATLASGSASASGGDGEGPPFITNHPDPITVSPTFGSGGTGSAGGAGGRTATVRDNYVGSPTFTPWDLFRANGVAGSAGDGGQAPQGGGGGGGGCFGGGGGGDGGGGGGGSSCVAVDVAATANSNSPVSTGSGPVIECEPVDPAVGATVTCTITGADAGAEIFWQAYAGDAVHAGGPVRIGPDGSGILRFTVLHSALGQQLSVELVEWVRPIRLGIVGGPVPASVPAGDGRVLPLSAVVFACVAAGLIRARRREAHAIPPL